ncbi:FTO catalytic domain containing protein [Nitzschia inconspicua]|uniref:Alpha-ketoglutarate-dependent dioxygenase FTO n=1 Tax=Nitzschia inconspicua TaxID=303405 RepID=A0A9K3PS36_9STRA|nr:FTO catalytic domain containing protein [Nitzschia inconspicua]
MPKSRHRQRKNVDGTHNQAAAPPVPSSEMSSIIHLPPPFPSNLSKPSNGFLRDESPYRESFQAAIDGPYEGFVVDSVQELQQEKPTSDSLILQPDPVQHRYSQQTNAESEFDEQKSSGKNDQKKLKVTEAFVSFALNAMNDRGEFRQDVTQPFGLGTKCATTYVTRCLVGEPGTSYKYLGLRMFAAPFECNDSTRAIRQLGALMSERSAIHMHKLNERRRACGAPPCKGMNPSFNICLINRMVYTTDLKPTMALPSDSDDRQAKTSVSWHADSSLEHYSTIAVYQTLETPNSKNFKNKTNKESSLSKDWWVGLRVVHHAEGPNASSGRKGSSIEAALVLETPPVAVSLPSGSAYYLLDDFNHHHQHVVFTTGNETSTGVRYSCTFRKLRESHNVQYWIERATAFKKSFNKKGAKIWKAENLVSQELEFEWIRQFYIQGKRHYDCLWVAHWKKPLQELLSLWSCLEHRAYQTIELLRAAAEAKCGMDLDNSACRPSKGERKERGRRRKALSTVEALLSRSDAEVGSGASSQFYIPMAECLEEQAKKRELWDKRERDHVFREMHPDCRPLPVPFRFYRPVGEPVLPSCEWGSSPFPKAPTALKELARQLRQLGEAFDEGDASKIVLPSWKHAVSTEWGGWEEGTFGLELQEPWAGAVVDGSKSIETRLYPLPPALLGKRIYVLESKSGAAGVSNLGNFIDIGSHQLETADGESAVDSGSHVDIIGWLTVSSIKKYNHRIEFEQDESKHLVTSDSGYGWKDDGTPIYGWVLGDYHRYDCEHRKNDDAQQPSFSSGVRRFRSLFELSQNSRPVDVVDTNTNNSNSESFDASTGVSGKNKGKRSNKGHHHHHSNSNNAGKVKRRKRF